MKRQIRRVSTVVIAILAALTITIVAPAPAHAAGPPTTSPAAAVRFFSTNFDDFSCGFEYACTRVPYQDGWYVFKFHHRSGTYYLSHWYGSGTAWNNQTGGAAMRLLNSGGGLIQCIPTDTGPEVDFGPVYRLQLTPSAC